MSGTRNRVIARPFVVFSLFLLSFFGAGAQPATNPDFVWGNASYFNLNTGESVFFENTEIKLLSVHRQYNKFKIGNDTVTCRVSRRTLPVVAGKLRVFVADNFHVKSLSANNEGHGLLKKEVLLCVSNFNQSLLNTPDFVFPVSFNNGYSWNCDEDSYLFSFKGSGANIEKCNTEGVHFDMESSRLTKNNWLVAVENSVVEWIYPDNKNRNESSLLLKSTTNPSICYLYQHVDSKSLEIRKGQLIEKGDLIGTTFYGSGWGHFTFSVIYSGKVPEPGSCNDSVVNGFPQLYELHFNTTNPFYRSFKKGRLFFGKNSTINGNQKNASEFEDYTGKGWITADWNIAEKVETVSKGTEGNVRLNKVLFDKTPSKVVNPKSYFDYEIHVPDGKYRIRAKVGDVELPSWQKIVFEGVETNVITTEKGQFSWTPERIVKVADGRLTVRIYLDETSGKVAGLSEIVFQVAG